MKLAPLQEDHEHVMVSPNEFVKIDHRERTANFCSISLKTYILHQRNQFSRNDLALKQ